MTRMKPEEFAERMQDIQDTFGNDLEMVHLKMDDLMVKVLDELGYSKGIKIFEEMKKWYAQLLRSLSLRSTTKGENMKLSELKAGDVICTDDGFSCTYSTQHIVEADGYGDLFFKCSHDRHYLSGQVNFETKELMGIYYPSELQRSLSLR